MIKVNAIKVYDKDLERGAVTLQRAYTKHEGLELSEIMKVQREGDYINEQKIRYSKDNGRTFSEWEELPRKSFSEMFGEDERITWETKRTYNHRYNHYVGGLLTRFCIGGHKAAYKEMWASGAKTAFDHQYVFISETSMSDPISYKLVKYEDGDDFSRENPRNMNFLENNRGFLNAPIVLKNGDIAVPVSLQMDRACNMLGLDVMEIFPSIPHYAGALMIAIGKYNEETKEYDFTFSNPMVISDLKSSRGFNEPIIYELKTGRLLSVMRGSNMQYAPWNTRIEKGTPGYKWYCYSDDGGKTFTEPAPWEFDNGEKVCSSATISEFIRSSKNGKLYWIGNVTKDAYDNFPRYPLHICEVDEEKAVLKRDTLTVIDTKREGESERVQLSNFTLFEDRETGEFEVSLIKIGQEEGKPPFFCETWVYRISVD